MTQVAISRQAIINADDFGFSRGISEGILQAHRHGLVTSTTIAANMPAAAWSVARLKEAPGLGVGVHLNASQGPPLSREGLRLAEPDGLMRLTAAEAVLSCALKPWLLKTMEAEFDAQIRWVLDHGIRPTHLDSHRHTHGYPPLFARVARLARRYNIRFVRRHRDGPARDGRLVAAPSPGQKRVARILNALGWFNERIAPTVIATRGTWGVAQTGQIDAEWLKRVAEALPAGATEIMVHPGLPDGLDEGVSRLRESRRQELAALCDPAVREAFARQGIQLVHYGQL